MANTSPRHVEAERLLTPGVDDVRPGPVEREPYGRVIQVLTVTAPGVDFPHAAQAAKTVRNMATLRSFAINRLRAVGHANIAVGLREMSCKPFRRRWTSLTSPDQQQSEITKLCNSSGGAGFVKVAATSGEFPAPSGCRGQRCRLTAFGSCGFCA